MAIDLKMPALSPTMEEGTLAKWLVKPGDEVKSGDILAEIETDKATMEFEAVDEGVIGALLVAEGTEGVKVGTVIATLQGEDDDAAPAPQPVAAPAPAPAPAAPDNLVVMAPPALPADETSATPGPAAPALFTGNTVTPPAPIEPVSHVGEAGE